MKIRWIFQFEYEDINFEKTHKFKVGISKEHAEAFGLAAQEIEADLTIEPKEKSNLIRQRGEINLILPGRQETKDLAYSIIDSTANQITFTQGKLSIIWSFVANELLPETPEEIEEVGDKPFSYTLGFQEVPDKKTFDGSFTKVVSNPLIQQFNAADNAQNSIDSFIGFFKILEDLYGSTPLKPRFIKPTKKGKKQKQDLKPSLKSSDELNQIALDNIKMEENGIVRPISQAEIETLLDKLVDTRHQCAHLKSSKGFGITYGDNRVHTEVKPLLEPLRILAFEAVQKHISKI